MPDFRSLKISLVCLVLCFIPDSLCVGGSADTNVRCIERERQALLEFKHAFVDDYGRLSSWESKGCCQWNGVQCNNQTGHVEKLDLHGDLMLLQPLRGEISASLMDLPYLTLLNLSLNDFNGSQIPEFLGSLSKLRYLDLWYSNFGGKIPNELGKLSSLLHLDLGSNNLVGVIPSQLGNLSNLKFLWLDGNDNLKFGEENHAAALWISNLSSLTVLDLTGSNLHGSNNWLQPIGSLPYLTALVLINCNLSDGDFRLSSSQPNTSTSLSYLDLSYNNLTSSMFLWFFNFSSNLIELYLSDNLIGGPIPYDFGNKLSHLEVLYIPRNQLQGTIPKSIGLLSELQTIDVGDNYLEGVVADIHFTNLTNLEHLVLLGNSLTFNFKNSWIPPFQLKELAVPYCNLGPAFPKWLQTQNQLSILDVSDTGISDTILELSFLLCGTSVSKRLNILYMSNNQFRGKIPDCLSNLNSLIVLDLSNNNLSGNIPFTMGSLVEIKLLVLRNNLLTGELPSLKSCTKLVLLDVEDNQLTGPIPSWLGNSLQSLEMLILRKNHFYGCLPLYLCHLTNIKFLDLSLNNLSGQIPKCLNNFTAMSKEHDFSETEMEWIDQFGTHYFNFTLDIYPLMMWKGKELEFADNKRFLKIIDLSSNNLSGEIPTEFGDLVELVSLNLSRNNLSGQIPPELGKLRSLDSLDLSRNHLCGKIPSNLSQIDRIGVLDLSNNNLSGPIPIGTQLQSFDASFYSGNPKLCGAPLVKSCLHEVSVGPHKAISSQEKADSFLNEGFYASAGIGFFTGFWGIFGSLLLIRPWRHAYFNFLNNLGDQMYVMAVLTMMRYCRYFCN